MSADVLPFKLKEKPPAPGEMEAWRTLTKSWSDSMKQLITPRYWEAAKRGQ